MKQVLFALMVLVIAAWTTPVFGQDTSLLAQVTGKTEAEVVTYMGTLTDEQLTSLIAEAIKAAETDPTNAATVALRNVVLNAGSKVIGAKPADKQAAIISAIQAAAPGTSIGKDPQGLIVIVPPSAPAGGTPPPPPPAPKKDEETNKLVDKKNSDSEPAFRE